MLLIAGFINVYNIYAYVYIFINYLCSTLFHVLPFINHLKIILKVQSSTQTKIKRFYCTKFITAPVKGFHVIRKMPECTVEFSK